MEVSEKLVGRGSCMCLVLVSIMWIVAWVCMKGSSIFGDVWSSEGRRLDNEFLR